MPRQLRHTTSKRYLTHDEIVEIPLREELCQFRLRIWRGKESPAIVLTSQLTGGTSPSWASSQIANLAYQVYLGFTADRVLNFEDEVINRERRLFVLQFASFGHGLRRHLGQPSRWPCHWRDLEAMVGGAIDCPPAP
jgi:hypothetical protein